MSARKVHVSAVDLEKTPPLHASEPSDRGAPKSFGRTARRSAVWDVAGKFSSQGVLFVGSIFLARLLSPADFGIIAASRFFVQLATRLTQLGLNVSLVRMKEIRPEHASSVFVVNLVMGFVSFATLYLASPALGRLFSSPHVEKVLPVSAAAFLITPFGSVAAAMLNRHLRYRETVAIHWIDSVLGTLLAIVFAAFNFGYWSLVLGALGATVVATAARVSVAPWRPSLRFSRAALRDTLSFGLGFQAKKLLQFSSVNLDNVVVGKMLGLSALGFYDKAYGLTNQFTDRLTFDSSLFRIFAIIRDEPERFRKAVARAVLATSILTFSILSLCVVSADRLLLVLLGDQWRPAIGPFRVLALLGILRTSMRTVSAANESLGLVWLQTAQQLLFLLLMVLGVAAGSKWGVTTAALGLAPAVLLDTILSLQLLTRHSQLRLTDIASALWPSAAIAAVVSAIAVAADLTIESWLTESDWVRLTGMFAAGGCAYVACILWTPFRDVRKLIADGIDDLAPWLRRWIRVGVLKEPTRSRRAAGQVGGERVGTN